MKRKIDLTGTTIKVKKEYMKTLKAQLDDISDATTMMNIGSHKHKEASISLWTILHKLYPITKEYECSFNRNGNIHIKYRNGSIQAMKDDMRKKGYIA